MGMTTTASDHRDTSIAALESNNKSHFTAIGGYDELTSEFKMLRMNEAGALAVNQAPGTIPIPADRAYSNITGDFTVTPGAGDATLTIGSLTAFVLDQENVVNMHISVWDIGTGTIVHPGFTGFTIAGSVITLTGSDYLFAATDEVALYLEGPHKGYNIALDAYNQKIIDTDGNQVAIFFIPTAEYKSPGDFTATYASSTTFDVTGLPKAITSDGQISYLKVIPSTKTGSFYLVQGVDGVTFTHSAGTITIDGAGTPLAASDEYEFGYNALDKAYDSSSKSNYVSEVSPLYNRYTAAVNLATDQVIDDTPTIIGSGIDARGYDQLGVFIDLTEVGSTNVTIKVVHSHTSGGTEYQEIYLGSPTANKTSMNLNVYEFATDATQAIKLNIQLNNTTPYISLYIYDDNDGASTVVVDYVLGYGS